LENFFDRTIAIGMFYFHPKLIRADEERKKVLGFKISQTWATRKIVLYRIPGPLVG
jgi:hypothetical protein